MGQANKLLFILLAMTAMTAEHAFAESSPEIELRLVNSSGGQALEGIAVVTVWEKNHLGALSTDYIGEVYKRIVQTTDRDGRCHIPGYPVAEWHVQQMTLVIDPRFEAVTIGYFRIASVGHPSEPPRSLSLKISVRALADKYRSSEFSGNSGPESTTDGPWRADIQRPKSYLSHEIHYIRGENFDHFDWFAWAKAEGRKVDLVSIVHEWNQAKGDPHFVQEMKSKLEKFLK